MPDHSPRWRHRHRAALAAALAAAAAGTVAAVHQHDLNQQQPPPITAPAGTVRVTPADNLQAVITGGARSLRLAPGTYRQAISLKGIDGLTLSADGAGVVFDGSGIRDNGLTLLRCRNISLDGLTVQGYGENGLYAEAGDGLTVTRCRFLHNHHTGLLTAYVDHITLTDVEASGSGEEHGVYLSSSGDHYRISGLTARDNPRFGLQINAVNSDEVPVQGVSHDGISEDVQISGGTFERNGQGHIQFAGVQGGRIAGCEFGAGPEQAVTLWDDGAGTQYGSRDNEITGCQFGTRTAVKVRGKGSAGNHLHGNRYGAAVQQLLDAQGIRTVVDDRLER